MHHYCDEIKAGSDVTQTDSAVAHRRCFGEAKIRALNEWRQVQLQEAQRSRSGAGACGRSPLVTVPCNARLDVQFDASLDNSVSYLHSVLAIEVEKPYAAQSALADRRA